MKKGTLTLLVLFIFTTCYSQTNNTKKDKEKPAVSVKGAWTDADKKLAQEAIASVDEELDALGETKQAFIYCYMKKVEARYKSFAAADRHARGCEKLALKCVSELFK